MQFSETLIKATPCVASPIELSNVPGNNFLALGLAIHGLLPDFIQNINELFGPSIQKINDIDIITSYTVQRNMIPHDQHPHSGIHSTLCLDANPHHGH
jgi:hypothetical protein